MTEHEEKKAEEMFQSFQKNYTQEDERTVGENLGQDSDSLGDHERPGGGKRRESDCYCGSSLRGFAYRCHSRYYPGIGADR